MNIASWLQAAINQLKYADIQTARLDALVLLSDVTGHDKSWILAYPEHDLQGSEIELLNTKIVQRTQHIPLAYIRGRAEFYGREFIVNEHTLVPRPETETMIDLLKTLQPPAGTSILDVGTGSGCIAITAKLELPHTTIGACDIDEQCVQTAIRNAENLHANVSFFASNLLASASPADIILANLPYVPDTFHINTAATHEPAHAIYGGADGLDLYRTMFRQIDTLGQPQHILTEALPTTHHTLTSIAHSAGFDLVQTEDFIQHFSRR